MAAGKIQEGAYIHLLVEGQSRYIFFEEQDLFDSVKKEPELFDGLDVIYKAIKAKKGKPTKLFDGNYSPGKGCLIFLLRDRVEKMPNQQGQLKRVLACWGNKTQANGSFAWLLEDELTQSQASSSSGSSHEEE